MRTNTAHPAGHRPAPVADLDHTLATGTIVLGAIGLLLGAIGWSVPAILLGATGMAIGLWGQMMSTSRAERFVDLFGLLASFLALAVGFSQL